MFEIDNKNDNESLDTIIERGKCFFLQPRPKFIFNQDKVEEKLKKI